MKLRESFIYDLLPVIVLVSLIVTGVELFNYHNKHITEQQALEEYLLCALENSEEFMAEMEILLTPLYDLQKSISRAEYDPQTKKLTREISTSLEFVKEDINKVCDFMAIPLNDGMYRKDIVTLIRVETLFTKATLLLKKIETFQRTSLKYNQMYSL